MPIWSFIHLPVCMCTTVLQSSSHSYQPHTCILYLIQKSISTLSNTAYFLFWSWWIFMLTMFALDLVPLSLAGSSFEGWGTMSMLITQYLQWFANKINIFWTCKHKEFDWGPCGYGPGPIINILVITSLDWYCMLWNEADAVFSWCRVLNSI